MFVQISARRGASASTRASSSTKSRSDSLDDGLPEKFADFRKLTEAPGSFWLFRRSYVPVRSKDFRIGKWLYCGSVTWQFGLQPLNSIRVIVVAELGVGYDFDSSNAFLSRTKK